MINLVIFLLIFGCSYIAPFGGLNPKWGLDTRTWRKEKQEEEQHEEALTCTTTKAPPPLIFGCLFIAPFGSLNRKWGLDTRVWKKKKNKRRSNMRRALHALQQKHPLHFILFYFIFLFLPPFLSLLPLMGHINN